MTFAATLTASASVDEVRDAITALLSENRDLRYFDSSDDGLTSARTAGEQIRRHAAREERAAEMTTEGAKFVKVAVEMALPNMPLGDLWRTYRALKNCPEATS